MLWLGILLLSGLAHLTHAGETLVWSDDFTEFDLSKWTHDITMGGGGNWEFEYYVNNRSNSYVRDGILYMRPTFTADLIGEANVENGFTMDLWGSSPADMCTGNAFFGCERTAGAGGNFLNPIQSARIRTSESLNFKYGRLEVRAKLPKGDWIWPAIWLLPRLNSYGNWPASGEIDVLESRGNTGGYSAGGAETMMSTLHWGPYYLEDKWVETHAEYKLASGTLADDFHVYGLYWDETGLYTYIDSDANKVLSVSFAKDFWSVGGWGTKFNNPWQGRPSGAPFDQQFYLIFNVAVGGTNGYFPDGMGNKPWSDTDPHAVNSFWNNRAQWMSSWLGESAALQVDWVKLYQTTPTQSVHPPLAPVCTPPQTTTTTTTSTNFQTQAATASATTSNAVVLAFHSQALVMVLAIVAVLVARSL